MSIRMGMDPRVLEVVQRLAPYEGRPATLSAIAQEVGIGDALCAVYLKTLMSKDVIERKEDLRSGVSGYRMRPPALGDGEPDDGLVPQWDRKSLARVKRNNERIELRPALPSTDPVDDAIDSDAEDITDQRELE